MTGSTSPSGLTFSRIFASRALVLGLLALTLTACAPRVATRGNLVDDDRVASLHEGISRRADVAAALGTPTVVGTFDSANWYYIGQKTEKYAFFQPDVVERKVLAIRFDETGTVRKIEQLDLNAGREVDLVDRQTPTAGRELSFLEQMLGNVGRFSGGKAKGGPGNQSQAP